MGNEEIRVQKRVLAVHDISCFGKCSLTVALPIISAAGFECTVMPNAMLSTHTGIPGFTFKDLTEEMKPIAAHWKALGLGFDSIFTGFLCNKEQIDIVCDLIDNLRTDDSIVMVDPAMADNGELYSVFGPEFPGEMRKLCAKADVIKPNITEACLMLGKEYVPGPYSREWVEGLLRDLAGIGARHVVLTGVYFDSSRIGAAAYDCATGKVVYHLRDMVPGYYVGTGDIFSSVVVSAMLRGKSFSDSVGMAVDFTADCITRTYKAKTDLMHGVNFEESLPDLIRKLQA